MTKIANDFILPRLSDNSPISITILLLPATTTQIHQCKSAPSITSTHPDSPTFFDSSPKFMTGKDGLSSSVVETVAGFTAGVASTLCVHPLDLVKTRLQGTMTRVSVLTLPTCIFDPNILGPRFNNS